MLGKWNLNIGCHKGTLESRDSNNSEHDSLEECKEEVGRKEKDWSKMGYYVWYAFAIGPDGKRVELHSGTPYSR